MSFIEFARCIRNGSSHRKISLKSCLLSSLISCLNIRSSAFRNIFRNWCLLLNNFLFCSLIRLKCKAVSSKFSFLLWSCLTRIANRFSMLWILFQFIICQIEYFISIDNIASCSYKSRKRITSVKSRTMIWSTYNIAWKCWDHRSILFSISFDKTFISGRCSFSIISLIDAW